MFREPVVATLSGPSRCRRTLIDMNAAFAIVIGNVGPCADGLRAAGRVAVDLGTIEFDEAEGVIVALRLTVDI